MKRRHWHTCQPADLQRLARGWFLAARRLELQKLAVELGISRATAYRWAGSAEQLVGDVLAALVNDSFRNLSQRTTGHGAERVLQILQRAMSAADRFQPLRAFLNRDAPLALRILASRHGPVQACTIGNIEALLRAEMAAGHMQLAVEPRVMAYALTRTIESFLYGDLITGEHVDLDNANALLRLLLRQDVPPVAV